MKKRAVLYARVSGDDRSKTGGENVKDQLQICREHAEKQNYQIVAELAEDDKGASGANLHLPKLNEALEMARSGMFDVLIVRELDRLSRDLAKQLIVEQELKTAGVAIEYVLYDFPDTPEGRLNKNLRAMLAEYEREKIKQRMWRGRLRKIKNGDIINHEHPPFGYRNVIVDGKRQLAVDEDEAKVVRLVFQLYLEGDDTHGPMTIRGIAQYLTDFNVLTYSDRRNKGDCTQKRVAKPGHWSHSSVASILSNEAYTGIWYYGHKRWEKEDWIAMDVPEIVDKATFEAAQQRRQKRKQGDRVSGKHDYLLSGRIVCGHCGRIMIGTPNSNKKVGWFALYYRCQAVMTRRYDCEMGYKTYRADFLDHAVWEWIKSILSEDNNLQENLNVYRERQAEIHRPLVERLQIINDLIQDNEAQLARLLDLYLAGNFPAEILEERKIRIEQALAGLREERQRIEPQLVQVFDEAHVSSILEFAQSIRAELSEADCDFQVRRRIIRLLNVTGRAVIEDGKKVVYFHCVLGDNLVELPKRYSDARSRDTGSCCTSIRTTDRLPSRVKAAFWPGFL